jgi:hypothetical protein
MSVVLRLLGSVTFQLLAKQRLNGVNTQNHAQNRSPELPTPPAADCR